MREIWKLTWKLLLIALVAGGALGLTNELTRGPIAEQTAQAAVAARQQVLAQATEFELIAENENGCDNIYRGTANGQPAGYTAQVTVRGYGGPIEVVVGVDEAGTITGVSVGGSSFAETAGLGAKTKDAAFTDRYTGLDSNDPASIAVKQDGGTVDAVSSATISSRAVSGGVQAVCAALQTILTEGN